jgi:hypothetical protein
MPQSARVVMQANWICQSKAVLLLPREKVRVLNFMREEKIVS